MDNNSGFVNLIYMLIIALVSVLVLVGSYSRLLTAVKNKSRLSDRLVEEYKAESIVDNYLSLYYQDLLSEVDLGFPRTEKSDGATLRVSSEKNLAKNKITVALSKGLVSSEYNFYYLDGSDSSERKNIIFALDCTSSLVNSITIPSGFEKKVSVLGYGESTVWLDGEDGVYSCQSLDPDLGGTSSPGAAMIYLNNHLKGKENDYSIVLVLAGEPESVKETSGGVCLEEVDCTLCREKALEYLACSIADSNTKWNRYEKGNRSSEIQLEVVYVGRNLPDSDLNQILRKYPNKVEFVSSESEFGVLVNQIIGQKVGDGFVRATIEKVVD